MSIVSAPIFSTQIAADVVAVVVCSQIVGRHLRITEKRRLAIAAAAMKRRMITRSSALVVLLVLTSRPGPGD